jgi:transposase InsO family protein
MSKPQIWAIRAVQLGLSAVTDPDLRVVTAQEDRAPHARDGRCGNPRRRLGVLLRRDGFNMNKKKLSAYREKGLAVHRRRGRKRATGTRTPMILPDGPNQRWSLDFVADTRRFRIPCIVEDFTREALALVVDISIGGRRMARELDALIARRGKPTTIVSDNGTEMTSHAVLGPTAPGRLALHRARQAAATRLRREL